MVYLIIFFVHTVSTNAKFNIKNVQVTTTGGETTQGGLWCAARRVVDAEYHSGTRHREQGRIVHRSGIENRK